jgi:hypothetical protein
VLPVRRPRPSYGRSRLSPTCGHESRCSYPAPEGRPVDHGESGDHTCHVSCASTARPASCAPPRAPAYERQRPWMPARTFVRIVSEGCRSVRFVAVAVVEADPETDLVSDPVAGELSRLLGWLGDRVAACRAGEQADDAVRIDRIGLLEQLTAAVAAVQVAESVRFAQSQVEAQQAKGWDPQKVGRGVADQIALACRVSPTEGSRRLGAARALVVRPAANVRLVDPRANLRLCQPAGRHRNQAP